MPGIDRDYWLDFAKDNVSRSIQAREEAAAKLDEFLSWVWTIYTSIFALTSILGYVNSDPVLVITVSQPILVIMLARFFCRMVAMPSMSDKSNADPNVVSEIIMGFQVIVADRRRRLKNAIIATVFAIVSICFALVGYNLLDTDKDIKRDIRVLKLQKELHDQAIIPEDAANRANERLKQENTGYDQEFQRIIKRAKLECLERGDTKCLDSLKAIEKQ